MRSTFTKAVSGKERGERETGGNEEMRRGQGIERKEEVGEEWRD